MEREANFSQAARDLLFGKANAQEIPGQGLSAARMPERHTRVKITINLDGDIVKFFKEKAGQDGLGYQLLINQALREHIEGSKPERIAQEVGRLLLSSDTFLDSLCVRLEEFEGEC